jgi:glycosyltransferase involved in cell wall biosynthesis/RimJ/RimL family protein N-acetyltransferase
MYNVSIRPLIIDDASDSYRWRNDSEIWKFTGNKPNKFITEETEKKWLSEKLIETDSVRFAIIADNQYVGNIQITNISESKKGQYHIFIGEKSYWGKGIAKQATAQIIRIAKESLGLRELYLFVNPKHTSAIALYEKCGFVKINEEIKMTLNLSLAIGPTVSVFMMAYNHEHYILQALDGILMQKTNFDFEIVVGEDCSIDNTREIIVDCADRYPGKFKLLLHKKNIGAIANQNVIFNACTGKYVAICEGDDFWTDPYKLQKQVDFLEANEEFSICATNARVLNETTLEESEWPGTGQKEILTIKDIMRYGNGGATCTLLFRKDALFPIPQWFSDCSGGDWALQVICSGKGKMKYFREVMGVYRKHSAGISNSDDYASTIKLYEDFGLKTLEVVKKNLPHHRKELEALAAENWYLPLASFYYGNGEFKKSRQAILKVLSQSLQIKLSIKDLRRLIKLYIKTFL